MPDSAVTIDNGTGEVLSNAPEGFDVWQAKLVAAAKNYRDSMWEIGDLLNEGEAKFGEMFSQAVEETGLDKSTLSIYKHVALKVEILTRRQELSFSTHRVVAGLETKEQKRILKIAQELKLPSKELRKRLTAAQEGDADAFNPDWKPKIESLPCTAGDAAADHPAVEEEAAAEQAPWPQAATLPPDIDPRFRIAAALLGAIQEVQAYYKRPTSERLTPKQIYGFLAEQGVTFGQVKVFFSFYSTLHSIFRKP